MKAPASQLLAVTRSVEKRMVRISCPAHELQKVSGTSRQGNGATPPDSSLEGHLLWDVAIVTPGSASIILIFTDVFPACLQLVRAAMTRQWLVLIVHACSCFNTDLC